MDLRDEIALEAMKSLLSQCSPREWPADEVEVISARSYRMADAMLIHSKKKPKATPKTADGYPQQARDIVNQAWLKYAPLPTSTLKSDTGKVRILAILDQMHRIDAQPWSEIHQIVTYAARVWYPKGYMASPASLRQRTQAGDQMKWEAIQKQMSPQERQDAPDEESAPEKVTTEVELPPPSVEDLEMLHRLKEKRAHV